MRTAAAGGHNVITFETTNRTLISRHFAPYLQLIRLSSRVNLGIRSEGIFFVFRDGNGIPEYRYRCLIRRCCLDGNGLDL